MKLCRWKLLAGDARNSLRAFAQRKNFSEIVGGEVRPALATLGTFRLI